eukprot:COSAG01_NODE_47630_length_388_cov_1.359862_1_plen_128_part_11
MMSQLVESKQQMTDMQETVALMKSSELQHKTELEMAPASTVVPVGHAEANLAALPDRLQEQSAVAHLQAQREAHAEQVAVASAATAELKRVQALLDKECALRAAFEGEVVSLRLGHAAVLDSIAKEHL